jgi:two-component sensor histidine kinase
MDVAASGRDGLADSRAVRRSSTILTTLFVRHRYASLFFAVLSYAVATLAFGDELKVSANYFVLLPLIAASMCFGKVGGLAAGALGLPANLLLFAFLGRPEYSPASKIIAEASGIFLGFACGGLADYFRKMELEIEKRVAGEEALRAALEEKKLLLRELQHRVKNNLSVIKSLVQLQRNRSSDPVFLEASDELVGRIFAISLVHDMLDVESSFAMVDLTKFVEALVRNLEGGLGLEACPVGLDVRTEGCAIQIEAATSLGLIINEVLTNALKHAARFGEEESGAFVRRAKPSIRLSLRFEDPPEGARYRLVIVDDGPGPQGEDSTSRGLGLKLVRALARNLGGETKLEALVAAPWGDRSSDRETVGARFELVFPATFMELI